VLVLLIEVMVSAGLGVSLNDLASVAKNGKLLAYAGLANYILVPGVAILLLFLFQAKPLVAVGFLLVAVCPGAPFAPPLTTIAKDNVSSAVSLMVILAASSAILAPLLLSCLLPLTARGTDFKIDALKIVTTLLCTQLLPLGFGLFVRSRRPPLAEQLQKLANLLTAVLSVVVFTLILAVQYQTLAQIRWNGLLGISSLILMSLAVGWVSGGPAIEIRKAFGLTTAARNIGVALVIATASFPASAAVTAVVPFAIPRPLAWY
jgi:BASS family bile acid:Na+ symporter